MHPFRNALVPFVASALLLAACGDDDGTATTTDASAEDGGGGATSRPTVVVTSSVLGDIVENLVGDQAEVVTVMPAGADPHDFQASAQQANQIREADALIVNGAGFEAGLLDVVESAEGDGVATFEAISAVDRIEFGESAQDDADDHEEEDEHGDGADPHFFLDPVRTVAAAEGIGDFLSETVEGIDADALERSVTAYVEELEALHDEVEAALAGIDDDRRVLVTNHDAFGDFADRYDFEIVGTVIPSGSTAAGADAGDLARLADLIRDEGVPAIFADTSAGGGLAQTLASEVGADVAVVELFTESLGQDGSGGETYVEMVRANAQSIVAALA